jgi:predicted oxidoreductase
MQSRIIAGETAVSPIVAGMMNLAAWNLSTAQTGDFIKQCLDIGVTTFDHADIYGGYTCEEIFGRALAADPGLRPKMQLISKCGIQLLSPNRPNVYVKHYNTSRDHIIASAERSLRNLHTDYLDLLLIHRPDPLMDADAVAEAFSQLREAGKVRHFGVSNFTPWQFDLLASRLDFPLVANQVEFSVMHLEPLHDGVFDQCQRLGVTPMAWSPLGGGAIFHSDEARARRLRDALEQVGEEMGGAGVDQAALAWLMAHPGGVIPVLGTGKIERLERAVAAANMTLTRQQWFTIWEASAGHEVP